MQVSNAREAEVQKGIPPRVLGEELKKIAAEDSPAEIIKALEAAGLLDLFSPVLTGPKSNAVGLARLEKMARLMADDVRTRGARLGPFLYALAEKLNPKEKQALIKGTSLTKADVDQWQKLETRAKKLEAALKSARIRKASHVYHIVAGARPDEVLFLLYHSTVKPVQERLKNYFQKYVPLVQEITPEEWAAVPGKPGTPKYEKARADFLTYRLDRRPPKKPEPPPEPPPVPEPTTMMRRGGGGR
jgi:tRNA nucleotidyltransferase/poly(A) polymerase